MKHEIRHSRGSRTDPRGNGYSLGKRLPGLGKIPANFPASPLIHVTAQNVSDTSRGAAGVSSVGANTTYA